MSEGPTFQQTTNGGSPQVNQGVTINEPTNITNNGQANSPTAEIFQPIIEGLKDKEWSADAPEALKLKFANPLAMVESAQKSADAEIAAGGDTNPERFEQKKTAWFEWLKSITPMLTNGAVKVGLTVLDKYADQSPTIAGLKMALSLVNEANGETPNAKEPKQHAVPMTEVPPKTLPKEENNGTEQKPEKAS